MKKINSFYFFLISTITKAQIGGGYDLAMNFGMEPTLMKMHRRNGNYFF
jgi:hypothetical protein